MSTLDSRVQARISAIRSQQEHGPRLRDQVAERRHRLSGMSMRDDPDAFLDLRDEIEALEEQLSGLEDADTQYMLETMPYLQTAEQETSAPAAATPFDKIFGKIAKAGKSSRKGDVFNNYLLNVEHDPSAVLPITACKEAEFVCTGCKGALLVDSHMSTLVCPDCGMSYDYFENSERNVTYDQEQHMQRSSIFAYKRSNHMMDWVNSAGGNENTEIPPHVLEALRAELRKDRVTRSNQITPTRIRAYLRKLKFTDLYDHSTYITQLLNGEAPPKFSPELTSRLLAMFNAIQEPFERHKHVTNRNNSLSYSYLLHKMCELLGEDWALPVFSKLKCSNKLFLCDKIWKLICADLRWEWIPSV